MDDSNEQGFESNDVQRYYNIKICVDKFLKLIKKKNHINSNNYLNVKAIYHQSVQDKVSFSEQIRNIQQDRIEALHYENEKNALKNRRGCNLTIYFI